MCMGKKRIAIVQSNYLPWKGFFDLIASVDEFVLFDGFQYTRRSWRNRNRFKTPHGLQWLTVPVAGAPQRTPISEIRIAPGNWHRRHLNALRTSYGRAPCFAEIMDLIAPVFMAPPQTLSHFNEALIRRICAYLDIPTLIRTHRHYSAVDHRQYRLRDICLQAGASVYVSGPAARCYLDEALLAEDGIDVEWFDYEGYPEYSQLWGPFVHEVSILDLMFNLGPDSRSYMKCSENEVSEPSSVAHVAPAPEMLAA